MSNLRQLIETELEKRPDRDPTHKSDGVWIRCPYHGGGNERTASMRIRVDSNYRVGSHKCFGCNRWSSDWNDLAKTLGLRQTKLSDQTYVAGDFSFDEDIEEPIPDITQMQKWPNTQDWRGITGKTLELMQARMEYRRNKVMLYLPVHVHRKYVGGIHCELVVTREMKDSGQLSYVNVSGTWSKQNVFGYDIAKKRRGALWVVEGPRDTANIIQFGGRVVGLLGSYVGKSKVELIESLDPPMVIIATDPDAAGDKAAASLEEKIEFIPTVRVNFPKGKDAADMTRKIYEKLSRRLQER